MAISAVPSTDLGSRVTRREAVRTYVPPALTLIGAGGLRHFGTSGKVRSAPGKSKGGSRGPKKNGPKKHKN